MHDWKYSQRKALEKRLYRNIHIARTSPDYQITYPAEVKVNPKKLVLKAPHPDAKKRIEHDFMVRIRNSFQPKVERPERFNKIE